MSSSIPNLLSPELRLREPLRSASDVLQCNRHSRSFTAALRQVILESLSEDFTWVNL